MSEIETVIGGLFIAILHALGPDRAERATDMLATFISGSRTGDFERQFYKDLIECIDMAGAPQPSFDFDCLATVH